MRTLLALTALLLTPAAFAQASLTLEASDTQSCPVGVIARHTPQGAVEQVRDTSEHHKLAYNIAIRTLDTRLITQARITLLGLNGPQITPVAQSPSANATETFTLTPGASPRPSFNSVVYTQNLTGVRFIQVDEITYADGTHWHQTANHICRVIPNGLLLVNATAH